MTNEQIAEQVESWNWNLSIFEIYDEVRENSQEDNNKLLNYAYHFFNQSEWIGELAYFLDVEIKKDGKIVGGKVVSV